MRAIDATATRAAEATATAAAWENMCRGITVISVLHDRSARYDEPGSMSPHHTCAVMFVPAELIARENDPLSYLQRHADRVLIVDAP